VRTFYLITHPNVVISRDVPVPRWPLSELGKQRMRAGLRQPDTHRLPQYGVLQHRAAGTGPVPQLGRHDKILRRRTERDEHGSGCEEKSYH